MASALSKVSLVYKDAKGQTGAVKFYVNADSPADFTAVVQGTQAAIAPITNAVLFSIPGGWDGLEATGELGNTGTYQDITLKANMVFVDSNGTIHRYQIPAPKLSIFEPDGVTVDADDVNVAAFVTAMLFAYPGPSHVTSRQGNVLTNFVGGTLLKRKFRRRLNIFIEDPDLNQPAE